MYTLSLTNNYIIFIFWGFFLTIITINILIIRNKAIYYLVGFIADSECIEFSYYYKNKFKLNKILWKDLDFCYNKLRKDEVFSISDKKTRIFTIYRSVSKHNVVLVELYQIMFEFIPKKRIIIEKSVFDYFLKSKMPTAYTSIDLFTIF